MNGPVSGAVVITGASTGIGEACARMLDARGMRVFAGVRNDQDGARLQEGCSARLEPIYLDVTEPVSIGEARDRVSEAVGDLGLAGLVNNAGIAVGGPLETLPMERFRRQFEVNVFGVLETTQQFLPLLRQARGRLVLMSSIAGRSVSPMLGAYGASKYALEAMGDAFRIELRRAGIQVSLVEPGAIRTPIWEKATGASNQSFKEITDEARAIYGEAVTAIIEYAREAEARAIPAEAVAEAVTHALLSANPKVRYLVGNDAWFRIALELLPTRLRDYLFAQRLKLA
jgi:NAD(P)-dependent dehydrogenase (short-subunit alcohol dehydrogenase family)